MEPSPTKSPLIAALMSALIFPGAGQFFLKRRLRALAFIVPALLSAAYFLRQAMAGASVLVDEVMRGTLAPDPLQIAAELERQGSVSTPAMNLAALIMLGCWLASIADAWLLGRRLAAPPPSPASHLKGRP